MNKREHIIYSSNFTASLKKQTEGFMILEKTDVVVRYVSVIYCILHYERNTENVKRYTQWVICVAILCEGFLITFTKVTSNVNL